MMFLIKAAGKCAHDVVVKPSGSTNFAKNSEYFKKPGVGVFTVGTTILCGENALVYSRRTVSGAEIAELKKKVFDFPISVRRNNLCNSESIEFSVSSDLVRARHSIFVVPKALRFVLIPRLPENSARKATRRLVRSEDLLIPVEPYTCVTQCINTLPKMTPFTSLRLRIFRQTRKSSSSTDRHLSGPWLIWKGSKHGLRWSRNS